MGHRRGLVITGASLLGERTGDLYVDDAGCSSTRRPRAPRSSTPTASWRCPVSSTCTPTCASPGREDAETILTGSRAAAVGGFTAVLAMANTSPVTDTAEAALRVLDLGREAGLVHVQPVGAVTRGLGGEELAELGLMARSRARVRVFSDDGKCVHDARVMRRALEYVKAFGGVVSQHAQDPTLAGPASCCHEGELSGRLGLPGWPGIAEEVIVARDVMLARHTGSRVHVAHVSTAGSVEVLRWAKAQGIDVTAEVTPHHLLLTTDLLTGYDPTFKVNPPLRPQEDVDALRAALADGTIDAVATDHAPHARHDKEHAFVDAAFGMLGLETALGVVRTALPDLSLGAGRPGHVDHAGAHRRARRPRVARPRHAGAPDARRPGRHGHRRPGRLGVAVAQQPLARAGAGLARRPHGVRRSAHRPRRGAGVLGSAHGHHHRRAARGDRRRAVGAGAHQGADRADRHRPRLAGRDALLRAGHRGRRRTLRRQPQGRPTGPAGARARRPHRRGGGAAGQPTGRRLPQRAGQPPRRPRTSSCPVAATPCASTGGPGSSATPTGLRRPGRDRTASGARHGRRDRDDLLPLRQGVLPLPAVGPRPRGRRPRRCPGGP